MRPISPLLALACALSLPACGADGEPAGGAPETKRVEINGERTSGRRAKATAKGIVERPASIAIRVSAAPRQRVKVSWGLSCPKTATGEDDSSPGGTYTTTKAADRALPLPKRTIAFCAVRAQAQLTRSGRVKVAIVGRRR